MGFSELCKCIRSSIYLYFHLGVVLVRYFYDCLVVKILDFYLAIYKRPAYCSNLSIKAKTNQLCDNVFGIQSPPRGNILIHLTLTLMLQLIFSAASLQ